MPTRKMGAIVLAVMMGAAVLVMAPAASAEPHCADGWRFTDVKRLPKSLTVTERLRAENTTSRMQTVTFTSKKSTERGWSLDVQMKGSIGGIFASIETSVGGGITRTSTAEKGIAVKADVPPRSYVIGRYGVFMRRFSGRLTHGKNSQCTYDRRRTVRAPSGETGWRVTKYKIK